MNLVCGAEYRNMHHVQAESAFARTHKVVPNFKSHSHRNKKGPRCCPSKPPKYVRNSRQVSLKFVVRGKADLASQMVAAKKHVPIIKKRMSLYTLAIYDPPILSQLRFEVAHRGLLIADIPVTCRHQSFQPTSV